MCSPSNEECWGAGLLQESLRLSSQRHMMPMHDAINAAERELQLQIVEDTFEGFLWKIPVCVQRGLEFTSFVPSTASINVEDFGTRVKPFNWSVFACVAACVLAVLVHETLVSKGMRPPLSPRNTSLREGTFCHIYVILHATFVFSHMAMLVPISLDVALSLHKNAAFSGLFLSIGTVATFVAIPLGKRLVHEENWDQKSVRDLLVRCAFVHVLVSFSQAWFMNATASTGLNDLICCVYVCTTLVISFASGLAAIPAMIFWNKLQTPEERTIWMIALQICRLLGFVVGPFFFVVVNTWVTAAGPRLHPRSLLAWVQAFSTLSAISILLLAALALPVVVPDQVEPNESVGVEQTPATEAVEAGPEELADDARRRVVWHMIYYSFERPFTVSAVEVATVMMLEVFYGWDPYTTGICFTTISVAGIVFSVFGMWLVDRGYARESTCFMASSIAGLIGVFLLFDTGLNGASTLLIADAMIYGGACLANGIAEGWASRAAKDGTDFTIGDYRMRNFLATTVARFLGPVVARALIDLGGRNVYAAMQVILCFFGTRTVYRTCRIVWDFSDFRQASRPAAAACEDDKTPEAANDFSDPEKLQDPPEVREQSSTSTDSAQSSQSSRGRSPTARPLNRDSPKSP